MKNIVKEIYVLAPNLLAYEFHVKRITERLKEDPVIQIIEESNEINISILFKKIINPSDIYGRLGCYYFTVGAIQEDYYEEMIYNLNKNRFKKIEYNQIDFILNLPLNEFLDEGDRL